jgi:hypothetical protein
VRVAIEGKQVGGDIVFDVAEGAARGGVIGVGEAAPPKRGIEFRSLPNDLRAQPAKLLVGRVITGRIGNMKFHSMIMFLMGRRAAAACNLIGLKISKNRYLIGSMAIILCVVKVV